MSSRPGLAPSVPSNAAAAFWHGWRAGAIVAIAGIAALGSLLWLWG